MAVPRDSAALPWLHVKDTKTLTQTHAPEADRGAHNSRDAGEAASWTGEWGRGGGARRPGSVTADAP